MSTPAEKVVDTYAERATWAHAESSATTPLLLPQALSRIAGVAEFPCGPGNFLACYAHWGVQVRLIDASWPMLTTAAQQAHTAGVTELAVGCHFLDQLPLLTEGLIVVPNGALNQLSAQVPLPQVLRHLRDAAPPGAQLLIQYLPAGGPGCTFYSPTAADGTSIPDRRFTTSESGEVTRHRRQYHDPDTSRVRIEFTHTAHGTDATTPVELFLPSQAEVDAALARTGWSTAHTRTRGGFREILATAGSRP